MPQKSHRFDEFDESWDDDDDLGTPDDEPVDTIRCPECRRDVYEDAEACPYCGHFLVADTSAWAGRPMWWIVLGFVGIVALVGSLILLFP